MAQPRDMQIGWRVWAVGIVLLGLVSLVLGNFDPGQPVPKWFPARVPLAYAANMFLIVAGLAAQWPRVTARAAAALTVYYAVIVVLLMDGRGILLHPFVFGAYSNTAEQLALAAAGLIVTNPRLTRLGQILFGICAVLFGLAHFVYMNLTAPLVPAWLPPSQLFWGTATGIAHIAAGVAILTGIRARLAAILLTIMYAGFTVLVHLPLLLGDPRNAFFWTENALNIALIGAAWVIADSAEPKA